MPRLLSQGRWPVGGLLLLVTATMLTPTPTASAYTNTAADGIAELNLREELGLSSQALIVLEADSGRVLYAENADVENPVASLTKLMTLLVVLEQADLATEVTITSEMLSGLDGYAVLGLADDQVLTVEELLYATILPSAADAAQALAFSVGGSIEGFAELMNAKAAELGLEHTAFSNPVGMDESASGVANYSTARDIATILQAGLKNETFREIFEASEYYIESLDRTIRKTLNSTANQNSLDISMVTGAKTGFTYAAGRCLATTGTVTSNGAEADDIETADDATANLIIVTLGADTATTDYITDTTKLYNYFAENFSWQTVLAAGTVVQTVEVQNSPTKTVDLALDHAVSLYLPNDFDASDLWLGYAGADPITAQNQLGSEIGTLSVYFGDALVYSEPETLEVEIYYHNWFFYIGGVVVVALVAFFGVRRGLQNRRRLRRRRR